MCFPKSEITPFRRMNSIPLNEPTMNLYFSPAIFNVAPISKRTTSGAKMRFPNVCMLLAERLNGCSIQRYLQPTLSNRIRVSLVRAYQQQLRINVIPYFPDAVCDFLTYFWNANECLSSNLSSGRLRDMCGAWQVYHSNLGVRIRKVFV